MSSIPTIKTVNEMERIYGPLNTSIGVFNFMMNQKSPYWTKHEFRGKTYIMTFEYNIYECVKEKSNG